MLDWSATVAVNVALGSVVLLYVGRRVFRSRSSYQLPPGPPGLPWLGNVFEVNGKAPWTTYAEWAKTYGDLVYSQALGKDIIIINSEKIAKDLLENRSTTYSDRPDLITTHLCGLEFFTPGMAYGDRWRQQRRVFHQSFRFGEASRFVPYQHRKACNLLRRILHTPNELEHHVFEYTASLILNCTYDYDPTSRKDELVEIMGNVLDSIIPVLRPDLAVILDTFPFLLYLPHWFPGMSFKKDLPNARAAVKEYLDRPFDHALRNVNGSISPSMVQDALKSVEDKGASPEASWLHMLKEAAGSAFLAASETSNSFLMTFFLMIMLNPEIQTKAQAQIDEVVGKGRLPTIEDRPMLPWIDAIIRETLRYSPVVPLSIPRVLLDDDVYNGFRIPKGALIFTNLWSMGRDEIKYPNADTFMPERFFNDDGSLKPNDTNHIAFGFGRRICVGNHFADTSMWNVVSKVLAVFKVLKPLNENGVEINVEPRFSSGITIHPLPFQCRFVPRIAGMDAEQLEQLISA